MRVGEGLKALRTMIEMCIVKSLNLDEKTVVCKSGGALGGVWCGNLGCMDAGTEQAACCSSEGREVNVRTVQGGKNGVVERVRGRTWMKDWIERF